VRSITCWVKQKSPNGDEQESGVQLSLIFQNLSAGVGTLGAVIGSFAVPCWVAEVSLGRSLHLSG
jgi:hypothetical protein